MAIKKRQPTIEQKKPAKKGIDSREITYTALTVLAVVILIVLYFYFTRSDNKITQGVATPPEGTTPATQTGEGREGKPQSGLPVVTGAKLQIETVDGVDIIKVIPEGTTKAGGPPAFIYQWTKNGQPAGENTDSISGFKRGDNIAVKITPFDGVDYGETKVFTTEIQNTPPKIVEHKEVGFDGNTLTYQVKATDRDGDRITYSLINPPAGMTIGPATGTITWQVKPEDTGTHNAQVKASDGYGGEDVYTITITISPPPS